MINIKNYCDEFIEYGKRLGYFSIDQGNKFKNKILEFEVIEDPTLLGDAVVNVINKTITYNPKMFKNEVFASQTIFHEFTHICSDIHNELFKTDGYWDKLRDNVTLFTNDNTYKKMSMDNKDNPYNYIKFGGLFLDEVIAEKVATEMVKEKFGKSISIEKRTFNCGDNNSISYTSSFDYYGIGEGLLNNFAKTLFIVGNKNLNSLARESFKNNFVRELIRQHNESEFSRDCFIKEIALMGIIAHTIEKSYGHYQDQLPISGDTVYDSVFDLQQLIQLGYENRTNIPSDIVFPNI